MTVYNTAYDTSACNGFITKKIVDAIRVARVSEYLRSVDNAVLIESSRGACSAIPVFNHPLYIGKRDVAHIHTSDNYDGGPCLAVDLRTAGRMDEANNKFTVVNRTIYNTRLYRGALTGVWLTQGPAAVRNLTPMAMSVFASWISESIKNRFMLDPKTQYDLMILAAIWYASNHVNGSTFDKMQENRTLASITNSLGVDMKDVMTMYDLTGCVDSTADFCKKAKTHLNNIRLEALNEVLLVNLLGGTWFGENSMEVIYVALEHPPTWLSILLEAYTNTMMRKTPIAKICERRQHQNGLELLVRAVKALVPETAALAASNK